MKSKIKIILLVFIFLLVGIAVSIPKKTYDKWFGKEDIDTPVENVETKLIYVKNNKDMLVGLEVPIKEENEDEIIQKWNLLTIHSENIPQGYESTVKESTILNSYKVSDGILELNVSSDIIQSDGRKTVESLAWTFLNDEIQEVKLFVDGQEVKEINDYVIKRIDKNQGINLELETSYLFESNATTIIYYEENYILPVTYLHLEEDVCSYIVEKTYDRYSLDEEVWNYKYTLTEESLEVNFIENLEIKEEALLTLSNSFDLNFNIVNLSINNAENNLYQATFGEIIEE